MNNCFVPYDVAGAVVVIAEQELAFADHGFPFFSSFRRRD
jgi:hypothetical protein